MTAMGRLCRACELLLNAGERRAELLTIRGGGHAEAIAAQPSAVASHARDGHVGGRRASSVC